MAITWRLCRDGCVKRLTEKSAFPVPQHARPATHPLIPGASTALIAAPLTRNASTAQVVVLTSEPQEHRHCPCTCHSIAEFGTEYEMETPWGQILSEPPDAADQLSPRHNRDRAVWRFNKWVVVVWM